MNCTHAKSLVICLSVMIIAAALWSRGSWAGPGPQGPQPLCYGRVAFEAPPDNVVISSSTGVDFSGRVYATGSIRKIENRELLAEIYYGAPPNTPAVLENVPSTKIDLGSVIASVACITKKDDRKTCRVSLIPPRGASKPLIFSYRDLPEPDSAIMDRMWRSAHTDERCKEGE